MRFKFLWPVLLFVIAGEVHAQSYADLYLQSKEEYKKGNFESFLLLTEKADSIRPNHRVIMYNLAAGYSITGQPEKALETLSQRASFYADSAYKEDQDFKNILGMDASQELDRKIRELTLRRQKSKPAFEINQPGFHPEGIAYNPSDSLFYISDIRSGQIVKYDLNGKRKGIFIDLANGGFWSAMGLKVDTVRNVLWVATAAIPEFEGYRDADEGKSAVLKVSLESARFLKIIEAPGTEKAHLFGDLTISENGTVYVTDSVQPDIYVIQPEANEMKLTIQNKKWWNLQGLALSQNNRVLFVADYILGIYRIDLVSQKISPLIPGNDNIYTRGSDGIYLRGSKLIFLQNGTFPVRIGYVELDKENKAVRSTLLFPDQAVDEISEPTLGVVVSDTVYYIANSPWAFYDKDFNPQKGEWPLLKVFRLILD